MFFARSERRDEEEIAREREREGVQDSVREEEGDTGALWGGPFFFFVCCGGSLMSTEVGERGQWSVLGASDGPRPGRVYTIEGMSAEAVVRRARGF